MAIYWCIIKDNFYEQSKRKSCNTIFSILLLLVTFLVASPSIASASIAETESELHATAVASEQAQININTASAVEIAAAMKGVGLKTADAIVTYRKANGPFKTIKSVTKVKGVGDKTLLKNKGVIVLE